jgi:putative N6-adenine-specific DNA methylase
MPADSPSSSEVRAYLAVCTKGLEPVAAGELRALGAADVAEGRGSVEFRGTRETFYRANLHLRTAVRVLEPVVAGDAGGPQELYDLVRSVDWSAYMNVDQTLSVEAHVRDSNISHSGFAALRVKDAVVDRFRDTFGRRPSVDRDNPDCALALRIFRNRASLAVDGSGDSLHKRGWRPIQVKSPLNEALAAGILLLTAWDRSSPLVDPMCGSGTLLIEAALSAGNVPPGVFRKRFAFENRPDFDKALWERIRGEALAGVRPLPRGLLFGADIHAGAVELAKVAARNAGADRAVTLECKDIGEWMPSVPPARVVVNPPYGERIGDRSELPRLYEKLGEFLKQRCKGASAFVLSGSAELTRHIGLKATRKWPLFNGPIECRLLQYDMY